MALASGDILVYDGSQWNNQQSLPGPFSVDSPTFYVDSAGHQVGIGIAASLAAKLHVTAPDHWDGVVADNTTKKNGSPDAWRVITASRSTETTRGEQT